MSSSEAFVILATNDVYALGALVRAQSIRKVGTKRNLVVLISNHLSDLIRFKFDFLVKSFSKRIFSFRKSLEENFDEVLIVDQLDSNDQRTFTILIST